MRSFIIFEKGMQERQTGGGNLVVAIIIAIIVGTVVYFLIDSKTAGEPEAGVNSGAVMMPSGDSVSNVTGG